MPTALAAGRTAPDTITGIARVIDGDTLDIGGTRIRLALVDAPERDQTCDLAGKPMPCGAAARHLLQTLAEGRRATCLPGPTLSYGRIVGMCQVQGRNLSLALLDAGAGALMQHYLPEWPDQAKAMQAAETAAHAARIGIWGMRAETPAAFRAARRKGDCPADRPVKANDSNNGRIYHLPGSPAYAKTRISGPDEACLPSARAARAAGFRPARS